MDCGVNSSVWPNDDVGMLYRAEYVKNSPDLHPLLVNDYRISLGNLCLNSFDRLATYYQSVLNYMEGGAQPSQTATFIYIDIEVLFKHSENVLLMGSTWARPKDLSALAGIIK